MSRTKLSLILLFILALSASFFIYRRWFGGVAVKVDDSGNVSATAATVPALNGLPVEPDTAKRRPVAIMIENHPDARPQSGLGSADLVYEALAEGGITRFLAVYQTQNPTSVGPIRSARDYYASIANELGALYAHVGGSDEVLAQLANHNYAQLDDLNQFYNGGYFERIKTRVAPHNVYSSLEVLRTYLKDKDLRDTAHYTPWGYKTEGSLPLSGQNQNATNIKILFSTVSYNVSYRYQPETNSYARSIVGKPDIDQATNKQLSAKTIIVQFVSVSAIPGDEKARIDVDLSGQGTAYIFQDGTITKARWKKSGDERTLYTDLSGNALSFNPGVGWIELVPNDSPTERVTWTGAEQ